MSAPSIFPFRRSGNLSATNAPAILTGTLGSHTGRIASPHMVRLSCLRDIAWALSTPHEMPPFLFAWNPRTSETVWQRELIRPGVFDVSADGKTLFYTDNSGHGVLLNALDGIEVGSLRDVPGDTTDVRISSTSERKVLVSRGGRVRLWSLDTAEIVSEMAGCAPIAMSSDALKIAYCNASKTTATVLNVSDAHTMVLRAQPRGHITAIDLGTPHCIALGHTDGTTVEHSLVGHQKKVHRAEVPSPVSSLRSDGGRIVSGHRNGLLAIRERSADTHPCLLWGDGAVGSIAPTLDTALHQEPNAAVLVEASSRIRFDVRRGHRDAVTSIALSADGHTTITASRDGTLRRWRTHTGEELDVLEGHTGPVCSVALSPDGLVAWSAGEQDGLRIWNLDVSTERSHHSDLPNQLTNLSVDASGQRVLAIAKHLKKSIILDADGNLVAHHPTQSQQDSGIGFFGRTTVCVVSGTAVDDGIQLTLVNSMTGTLMEPLVVSPDGRPQTRARPCWLYRMSTLGDVVMGNTERNTLSRCRDALGEIDTRLPGGAQVLGYNLAAVGTSVAIASAGNNRVLVCAMNAGTVSSIRLPNRNDHVTALALSRDERFFLVGTSQGVILRYEILVGGYI
jgi:WD40 repeat protein